MEELDEVDVVLLLAEVLLEEVVDGSFEHERVVDGDVSDVFLRQRRVGELALGAVSKPRYDSQLGTSTVARDV